MLDKKDYLFKDDVEFARDFIHYPTSLDIIDLPIDIYEAKYQRVEASNKYNLKYIKDKK